MLLLKYGRVLDQIGNYCTFHDFWWLWLGAIKKHALWLFLGAAKIWKALSRFLFNKLTASVIYRWLISKYAIVLVLIFSCVTFIRSFWIMIDPRNIYHPFWWDFWKSLVEEQTQMLIPIATDVEFTVLWIVSEELHYGKYSIVKIVLSLPCRFSCLKNTKTHFGKNERII